MPHQGQMSKVPPNSIKLHTLTKFIYSFLSHFHLAMLCIFFFTSVVLMIMFKFYIYLIDRPNRGPSGETGWRWYVCGTRARLKFKFGAISHFKIWYLSPKL